MKAARLARGGLVSLLRSDGDSAGRRVPHLDARMSMEGTVGINYPRSRMNNPIIDSLTYAVDSVDGAYDYDAAEPLSEEVSGIGTFDICNGQLQVALAVHCHDEQTARYLVEPFLRKWEIKTDLAQNSGGIRFRFEGSAFHDLSPSDDRASFGFSANITVSDSVQFIAKPQTYPGPPRDATIGVSDLVRDIHARWFQCQEGKEPAPSMAYYVLTRIQLEAQPEPTRKATAWTFNIARDVLDKIGDISSAAGKGPSARKALEYPGRKASASHSQQYNPQNDTWLKQAIARVIQHLMEDNREGLGRTLCMADLPPDPVE